MEREKILQIITANGIEAVFEKDGKEYTKTVVCYALVQRIGIEVTLNTSQVVPMITDLRGDIRLLTEVKDLGTYKGLTQNLMIVSVE